MGIFEIISAIVLIIAAVFIVIVVLMQDTKTQMSQTISGNTGDNYFGKNSGRTKEAQLNKAMITAAIIFFILAMVVNIANAYFGGSKSDDTSSSVTSSVVSEVSTSDGTAEDSGTLSQARQEARLRPPEQLRLANRMLKAQLPLLNSKKTGQALPPVLFVNNR